MIHNQKIRRYGAFVIITVCTLVAILAGVHWADGAMVKPASHSASQHHSAAHRPVPVMERFLSMPRCSDTSGRFDNQCWTEDHANGAYLSLDYGRYFYVLATRDLIGPNYSGKR